MIPPITFHGLLYVAAVPQRAINLGGSDSPLDVYLRCAVNCARSFARFGYDWRLITNDPDWVLRRAGELALSAPALVAMEFHRAVPDELGFAAAHRKLEVLARFGTGELGHRPALVDLDVELIRPMPAALLEEHDSVHALDLSAVMAAEFGDRVGETLAAILGKPVAARWYGGEFIAAPAPRFAELTQVVEQCWDRYLGQARGSIHEGDEAVTSAALSLLGEQGWTIVDAGGEGAVARWWSARTRVPMPRFHQAASAALLHLPADKPFLAARADRAPDPAHFVADYRSALRLKLPLRAAANALDRLRGTRRLHAPRW